MIPESYTFINRSPVIPVMVIDDLAQAVPMAQALVAGGIRTLEITLRTNCALDAISAIASAIEGVDVGAGTVCNSKQMKAAIDAGAGFIVSPGSSRELLDAADDLNIPLLPGAVTASEVMQVREAGYPVVKFFPASTSGGAPAIKAMQGPFSDMLFIPTGGVNLDNMVDYLRLSNVPAVGGSWILPDTAISTEDWSTVTRLTRQAIDYATTL